MTTCIQTLDRGGSVGTSHDKSAMPCGASGGSVGAYLVQSATLCSFETRDGFVGAHLDQSATPCSAFGAHLDQSATPCSAFGAHLDKSATLCGCVWDTL
jgi:hypothetical protein